MDYTWMFYTNHENVEALLSYFAKPIAECPEELILQIDGELASGYVFEGNNMHGRSFVQQSCIEGINSALEAVRAECVVAIAQRKAATRKARLKSVLFTMLGLARTTEKQVR